MLLDVRSPSIYRRKHARDATNIPLDELSNRLGELPDPTTQTHITVYASSPDGSKKACELLLTHRQRNVHAAAAAIDNDNDAATVVCNDGVSRRWWEPSALLVDAIDMIERELGIIHAPATRYYDANAAAANAATDTTAHGKFAVDLGCGAGRDVVYLCMRGWRVCAIDCSESMLERTRRLAASMCIHGITELIQCDLRQLQPLDDRYLDTHDTQTVDRVKRIRGVHLLNISRYLYRPVMIGPIVTRMIAPGGFVVFHHFMRGSEHTQIGRPKSAHKLLEPDELCAYFGDECGWRIHMDEVRTIPDGRPTSFFVAQKPIENSIHTK